MSYSRPAVYAYVPNFVSIGLFHRLVAAKKTQFLRFLPFFWTSAFSDVANCHQSQKIEHGCTTTNLPLSNSMKIVSVLQHLHSEIWGTISDVQKRDEQTDRQTDRQKTQRFWPPRWRVKSEPHQTGHGDRGPRARSCTSKTFGGLAWVLNITSVKFA